MKTRANTFELASILSVWIFIASTSALERLEPPSGSYFGFVLPPDDTIGELSSRLGFTPALAVRFFEFPFTDATRNSIHDFLEDVVRNNAIAMLTLEPWGGLNSVRDADLDEAADLCATFESKGITGIFIRFGHEMNGNWYPWGQQSIAYKSKFRTFAKKVHLRTSRTAMLWAPNNGIGYPFGAPRPEATSAEFRALDTNGDGRITTEDDMYDPYYPGDDVVDWVGMTLYHWGISYPWLENEMPPAGSFTNTIRGRYQGSMPDFYERYCGPEHRKPMAIPETAAFYNTERAGADEFAMKQAWWRQVIRGVADLPKLKCVNWFDEFKQESVANNNWIDWRVSASPPIRAAFVADLRGAGAPAHFYDAPEAQCLLAPYCVSGITLPHILPVNGTVAVKLNITAEQNCDLVIDLLDRNFVWQGGTRVPITAPGGPVSAQFMINTRLTDQTSYRWSIFLTPTGGDYTAALAWYRGPDPSDDPDGDGASNEEEFTAGTGPRDFRDVLAVKMERSTTGLELSFPSKAGRSYQILRSANLKIWKPMGPPMAGTGARLRFSPEPAEPFSAFKVQVTR